MRIATLVLAFVLSSCAPAKSSVAVPDDVGLVVSVRVVRVDPAGDLEPSTERGTDGAVDAGEALASPIDPMPEEELDTAEGRSHLGDLYARAGLLSEAILEYRQSIEIDPSNAVRHFKLGLAYQSVRQFEAALASYKEAARLEPNSAWAHAAVSIVHAKMGQQSAAFDSYQTVKELDDEMAEGLLEVILQYGSLHEV